MLDLTNITSGVRPTAEQVATDVQGNSWEYADAVTDYLTHNIHRYSGKFIPQIASRAIEMLTNPGERVLDVFCGSGTTILEAARLGRRGVGIDLSPLAVLISKVKVTPVEPFRLETLRRDLALALLESDPAAPCDLLTPLSTSEAARSESTRADEEWYQKWYGPNALKSLMAIDNAISRLKSEESRNIALVALSNILRRVSRAHSGYPNVMFDKNATDTSDAQKLFLRELDSICRQVARLGEIGPQLAQVEVRHGNSTALALPDASIDAVVTHPPYIGSIPYAEYGALSLKWLGVNPKDLDKELTGGRRQAKNVVERFVFDYRKILAETHRVLKPGRFLFLMVGNPVVKGELIDLVQISKELALAAGYQFTAAALRQGMNRRANKMGAETLLFFQK